MSDFFTDISFSTEKTEQYILSIQVSLDGFSFLVFQPEQKKVAAYNKIAAKISSETLFARRVKEWTLSELLFKSVFKEIHLYVFSENFTLVPSEYKNNFWGNELSMLFGRQSVQKQILENNIEHLNTINYFLAPEELIQHLQQFFGSDLKIFHPVSALAGLQTGIEGKKLAYILAAGKYFFLVVYRHGKLIIANRFDIQHQNDLIYCIVNAFLQLGIARSETEVIVSDLLNKQRDIKILLEPYFGNVKSLTASDFDNIPQLSNYLFLLNLSML